MSKKGFIVLTTTVLLVGFRPPALLAGPPKNGNTHRSTLPGTDSGFQVAAAKPVPEPDYTTEVRRLIRAANDNGERELNLSWGNSLGGAAGARKFEALFNRAYATKVKINYTPGPAMNEMAGKIVLEVTAGRRASTDIMLGTESHYGPMVRRNVFEEYDYTKLSPRITKDVVAPRNIGVEVRTSLGVIVYNTNSIPPTDVPRKLEDVLNPRWKGKIASTAQGAYFDRIALRPEWSPERLKAFVRKLSAHTGGLIRASESSRIISAEFVMLVLGSIDVVQAEMTKGAPLGFVVPGDGAIMPVNYMGVPRNSGHPNLAKLFINTVMSEEGQRLVYETTFTDHFALQGSRMQAAVGDLRAKGIQPLKSDVELDLQHPELGQLRDEIQTILRENPKR